MSTVVLSAASPEYPSLAALEGLLGETLRRRGETDVRTFTLATMPLAYCQGEFDCWVKTPGVCRAHDAETDIVRAIHDADRLVLLDVVTFGGHSYTLKRAQDRLICLLSPFFSVRASLTHHDARYGHPASIFALGWTPLANPDLIRTWNELADANALNMHAPYVGAALLDDRSAETWADAVATMLDSTAEPGAGIQDRGPLRAALFDAAAAIRDNAAAAPPQRAALLVGSAKVRGTSISERLAEAVRLRLEHAGVATQTFHATDFVRADNAADAARAIADAGLFVLVTPLYVDAFPALATRALECIHAARGNDAPPAACAMIVNCGFPEAEHTRTALRIGRHFSAATGYRWAGALPLGGGGALNPLTPLDAQHGPAAHVAAALDEAVPCLARGEAIPPSAVERMATAPIPDAVYRLMGDLGWRYQAYRNRLSQRALRAQPLEGPGQRGPTR